MKNAAERQVNTATPEAPDAAPRLPHERDESRDSQTSKPRKVIKQAYDDVENGLVDTSRTGIQGPDNTDTDANSLQNPAMTDAQKSHKRTSSSS